MMHKTYELVCHLSVPDASERIGTLLSKEGVEYKVSGVSITSTKTPIAVLGIQPKLYSYSNWIGVNPFVFISGIHAQFRSTDICVTAVTVRVNRLRAFFWVAFWVACSVLSAFAMREPAGAILVVIVTVAAWLGIVSFIGSYLIAKEIGDYLKK